MTRVKERDRLAAVSPKSDQVQLSRLARALRQAGASPEGKVRLLLRRARRDLQGLIGSFEGKDHLFFSVFKSYRDVLHGTNSFYYRFESIDATSIAKRIELDQ